MKKPYIAPQTHACHIESDHILATSNPYQNDLRIDLDVDADESSKAPKHNAWSVPW